jgi:hypothetical protein
MNYFSSLTRPASDPTVIRSGPSSLSGADRLSRALGWFSLGLGLAELLAPRRITMALGMQGNEALVRAYGAREIGSGILSLSVDKNTGLWSRVAGDGLDLATLLTGLRRDNPKRGNVAVGLAMIVGITAVDLLGAKAVTARHSRHGGTKQQYRHRSGFPQGVEKAWGAARDFQAPAGGKTAPTFFQAG